jgi:hypothetical protein
MNFNSDYTVICNDIEYSTLKVTYSDGTFLLVNSDVNINTGENLIFGLFWGTEPEDGIYGVAITNNNMTNLTLSVKEKKYKTIDKEYFPSIMSDWNAAENEFGYISNRTHYEYFTEIIPETEVTFDDGSSIGEINTSSSVRLIAGQTYQIIINDEKIISTCQDNNGQGSTIYGISKSNGLFGILDQGWDPLLFVWEKNSIPTTVSIAEYNIIKIPSKFITGESIKLSECENDLYYNKHEILSLLKEDFLYDEEKQEYYIHRTPALNFPMDPLLKNKMSCTMSIKYTSNFNWINYVTCHIDLFQSNNSCIYYCNNDDG